MPDAERVHTVPTPTAGGTAMFLAFVVALAVARLLPGPSFRLVFLDPRAAVGVLIAASAMFLVGFVDDLREVSAPAKVAGQVLAAMILYFAGVTMLQFKVPFAGYLILSPSILPLVTALWVIGIANAVNLIDGLDGLAAGVVAIASGALCVYGLRLEWLNLLPNGDIGPLIAAATCGLCIGFLPHNFHRAKIFMGDTGAMVLGLLMAASTMVIGGVAAPSWGQTYFFFVPLAVPFVILGVPIVDTVFAIIRRTVHRTGLAVRDLEHLHHRLMRLGHGHRRTVIVLWTWTLLLSALVLYPTFYPSWGGEIPIGLGVLAVALYTFFQPGLRKEPALEATKVGARAVGVSADVTPKISVPATPSVPAGESGAPDGFGLDTPAGPHRAHHRRRFARHDPPTRG
ncbi:MAG TPA: MraY family glycosyltransferase [Acidimicrobiales bacterium]|nr:MraY family glycosyltransferase [Acidimicrobiales bacterium]